MSNSLNTAGRILLLILITCSASLEPFASRNRVAAGRDNPIQDQVEQDISGSYKGLVLVFRDKVESQCAMAGLAKLDIKAKQFTLSKIQGKMLGKTLKGEITTVIRTDKGNLAVGELKLENEEAIEIFWHYDARHQILKIFSAEGANRSFRFCSANLTQSQCFGRI